MVTAVKHSIGKGEERTLGKAIRSRLGKLPTTPATQIPEGGTNHKAPGFMGRGRGGETCLTGTAERSP